MVIKKTYFDGSYMVIKLTDIEFNKDNGAVSLIGKLVDEEGCDEFREYNDVCVFMNENVNVVKY